MNSSIKESGFGVKCIDCGKSDVYPVFINALDHSKGLSKYRCNSCGREFYK